MSYCIEMGEFESMPVVKLAGAIGVLCEDLEQQLQKVIVRRPALVIVDLAGVTTISSFGMGVLLGLRRSLGMHGGKVRLAGAQRLVQEAFSRARLDTVLSFYPTVAEAAAGKAEAS